MKKEFAMIKALPTPIQNMLSTGLIFMYTANVQGTMADLIIAKKYPDLKRKFVATPKIVPKDYLKKRCKYWNYFWCCHKLSLKIRIFFRNDQVSHGSLNIRCVHKYKASTEHVLYWRG